MSTIGTENIKQQRPDLSPYLFHMTRGDNPLETMESILREQCLKAKNRNYLCFTNAPITSNIALLDYFEANYPYSPLYSKFGIGFSRDVMFDRYKARNVIYDIREDIPLIDDKPHWRYEELDIEKHDFSWLREWRIEGSMFDFSDFPKEHIVIIAPTKEDLFYLVGNEDIDVDFAYEHEIGDCIPYLSLSYTRNWKGFPIDEIKKMAGDYHMSGSTRNQKIGEDIAP